MEQKQSLDKEVLGDGKKQVSKVTRYTIWGVFLIIMGLVGALVLPEHSLEHFFSLLKEVIVHLILGA